MPVFAKMPTAQPWRKGAKSLLTAASFATPCPKLPVTIPRACQASSLGCPDALISRLRKKEALLKYLLTVRSSR